MGFGVWVGAATNAETLKDGNRKTAGPTEWAGGGSRKQCSAREQEFARRAGRTRGMDEGRFLRGACVWSPEPAGCRGQADACHSAARPSVKNGLEPPRKLFRVKSLGPARDKRSRRIPPRAAPQCGNWCVPVMAESLHCLRNQPGFRPGPGPLAMPLRLRWDLVACLRPLSECIPSGNTPF